jgi:CRP-like cAMP-binding protein
MGIVERVLAVKAISAFGDLHRDDLASLARAASFRRVAEGDRLEALDVDPSLHLLVEGRVRELGEGPDEGTHDAPTVLGLLDVLSAVSTGAHVAEVESTTLELPRAALLEVLEQDFEVWRAFLAQVCGSLAGEEPAPRSESSRARDADDLVDRILLLRGTSPFAAVGVHLLGQLATEMQVLEANAGAVLWRAGEPTRCAIAIVEGELEAPHKGGPLVAGPGQLLGLAAAICGAPHRSSARARSRLRALRLETPLLFDVLEDEPAGAVELLCSMARDAVDLVAGRSAQ